MRSLAPHTQRSSRSRHFVQLMMVALTFHHPCRRRRGKHSLVAAAAARSRACLSDQTIIAVRRDRLERSSLGPTAGVLKGRGMGRQVPAGRPATTSPPTDRATDQRLTLPRVDRLATSVARSHLRRTRHKKFVCCAHLPPSCCTSGSTDGRTRVGRQVSRECRRD